MAKDISKKEEFIRHRAEGLSFEKIARRIGVSKQSLLRWDTELQHQITQVRLIGFEALAEQYDLMKRQRVEQLAELRKRVLEELRNRDLQDVTTDKLVTILSQHLNIPVSGRNVED